MSYAGPEPGGLGEVDPGTFDWLAYLGRHDARLLATEEGRRVLTRYDPLLFALVYLRGHLSSPETDGQISFSRFHLAFCDQLLQWARRDLGPAEIREAWVAPRGSGKSSWAFLIGPLWALAHKHRRFIAAFADSASQAEQHLSSAKREVDSNELMRRDFPDLCAPGVRPAGATIADHRSLYVARSGAVFSAKGIDSSVLGAKVGSRRPDVLLFDDVEPSGSNYSAYQKGKRLATILDAVLPMNDRAVVIVAGTVTMPGSIVHDLARTVQQPDQPVEEWVRDERFTARVFPALDVDPVTGEPCSLWPQRWKLVDMQAIAHTRSFRLNMQNDPMAADGLYWSDEDIRYGLPEQPLTHQLLSIDPAVTDRGTSDATALAVIGYSKPAEMVVVRHVRGVRIAPGEQLRELVLRILESYPETTGIVIETNQGGDAWRAILHHMPVPVRTVHQSESKESRAARLLNHYQRGRVLHEHPHPSAEAELIAFPNGAHDDQLDAIGTGVEVFLGKRRKASARTTHYA